MIAMGFNKQQATLSRNGENVREARDEMKRGKNKKGRRKKALLYDYHTKNSPYVVLVCACARRASVECTKSSAVRR